MAQTHKEKERVMTDYGMAEWHYYSILNSFQLKNGDYIVKLRNPWGKKVWTGEYSSSDQASISSKEKIFSQIFEEEKKGIFYMPIDCFLQNFEEIDICECNPSHVYTQFEFNSFHIIKKKTQFFQVKVEKSGVYHLSFSQRDARDSSSYDYCSLILIKKNNFEFLKSIGNAVRDLPMKIKLEAGVIYYLYVRKKNNFFPPASCAEL